MIQSSIAPAANGNASCREVVRRALLERIGDGVLVPGERIVEARLAEEFGVSAIPVREAIRELVSMGVLAAANNRGGLSWDGRPYRQMQRREVRPPNLLCHGKNAWSRNPSGLQLPPGCHGFLQHRIASPGIP